MLTLEEDYKPITMQDLIDESVEIIKGVVKDAYHLMGRIAGVKTLPKIYIHQDMNVDRDMASYLPGRNIIVLNAIELQNKGAEKVAFVLAHELYHHKQYEDGERFDNYVTPGMGKEEYKNQRIEREANEFAARLFPDVKY